MCVVCVFFFQAEDGIRDLVRSRGLGDVYKRQVQLGCGHRVESGPPQVREIRIAEAVTPDLMFAKPGDCLLYTSEAADERSSVDLGGRRIIKKKNKEKIGYGCDSNKQRVGDGTNNSGKV